MITEPSYEVVHDALPSGYTVQPLIVKSEADKEIEKARAPPAHAWSRPRHPP